MSGYSCDQCKHRSCYIWANDGISDDECEGIQKGHPCKPVWECRMHIDNDKDMYVVSNLA